MKNRFLLFAGVALLSCACTQQPIEDFFGVDEDALLGITVNLPEIGEFQTRSTFVIDGSGVHVLWAENDTLGILPNVGDQVYFPMSSGAGSASAHFDGGAWGVKDANTYSSYFPFSKKYYTAAHNAIRLNYDGQQQDGNGDYAHLAAYDYLASGAAAPQNNYLTLNLVRLGAIACFKVSVPEPGIYTSAVIDSDADFVLSADLDVTGADPVLTPVSQSHSLTLSLKNVVTTTPGETVTLYMMVSPVNLTGHSLQIRLLGNGVSCYAALPQKNMEAGKPYMFQAGDASRAIGFKDALVKQLCVANWDTDGNGEISFEEAAAVTSIGNVFQGKRITSFDELQYFTALTSLSQSAFKGCSRLESILLPDDVTELGNDVFYECRKLKSIVLHEGLTQIPDMAFWSCDSLKSITIPSTVTRLGEYSLDRCSALQSLSLPDGLQTIGYMALRGLKKIKNISLPAGITEPSCNLFDGWEALESFTIPSTWTTLPHCAFYDCKSLTSLIVPEGITWIGHSCFLGCSSLASISLPSSLQFISSHAFENCSSLAGIAIPAGCCGDPQDGYGNYAHFLGCSSLQEIVVPGSWGEIGDDCFKDCTHLETVYVSEGITRLGGRCFRHCTALSSVSLPESLLRIDENCFEGCSALESIVLPSRITELEQGVFSGCSSLSSVSLPGGLVAIGSKTVTNGPFDRCTSLESIVFPESLRFIGPYSFYGCALESLLFPDGLSYIGSGAFEGCSDLTEVALPASLSTLNPGVFSGAHLGQLTIPSAVVSIFPFGLGNELTSLTLMGTTPPALSSALVIPANGCPIYVPGESLDAYKTAPIWSLYAERIQASSDSGAENPNPGGWQ